MPLLASAAAHEKHRLPAAVAAAAPMPPAKATLLSPTLPPPSHPAEAADEIGRVPLKSTAGGAVGSGAAGGAAAVLAPSASGTATPTRHHKRTTIAGSGEPLTVASQPGSLLPLGEGGSSAGPLLVPLLPSLAPEGGPSG